MAANPTEGSRRGKKIRSHGAEEGETRDGGAQARHASQRTLRQEGHESQAGDRDRSLGSPSRGRQSSKKAIQVLNAVATPAELPADGGGMNSAVLSAADFRQPAIALAGVVDNVMYGVFRQQLAMAPPSGLVVVELSTLGGDPE